MSGCARRAALFSVWSIVMVAQSSRVSRIENLPAPASSLLPGIGIFVRAMMAHSNL